MYFIIDNIINYYLAITKKEHEKIHNEIFGGINESDR